MAMALMNDSSGRFVSRRYCPFVRIEKPIQIAKGLNCWDLLLSESFTLLVIHQE